jgi:chromosome segregation ATPase
MTQIAQLEHRITKALDRIARGLEAQDGTFVNASSTCLDTIADLEAQKISALASARAAQTKLNDLISQLDEQGRELQRQSVEVTSLRVHIRMLREQMSFDKPNLGHRIGCSRS